MRIAFLLPIFYGSTLMPCLQVVFLVFESSRRRDVARSALSMNSHHSFEDDRAVRWHAGDNSKADAPYPPPQTTGNNKRHYKIQAKEDAEAASSKGYDRFSLRQANHTVDEREYQYRPANTLNIGKKTKDAPRFFVGEPVHAVVYGADIFSRCSYR